MTPGKPPDAGVFDRLGIAARSSSLWAACLQVSGRKGPENTSKSQFRLRKRHPSHPTWQRNRRNWQLECLKRGAPSREILTEWVEARGDFDGALLCPVTKSGRLQGRRMSDQAVFSRIRLRRQQAGLAHFSPHDLRRSYISHLLDAGVDIATVQKLAGHATVSTTCRYDRRGDDSQRRAAEALEWHPS